MKSFLRNIVSSILAAALITAGMREIHNQAQAQALPAGIVLVCVAIGACVIIKAMHRPEPLIDRVLVLQVNFRDGHGFQNIVTNFHATLYSQNPTSIFGVRIQNILDQNEFACFRVEDITDWWRQNHPLTPEEFEQQFAVVPGRFKLAWSVSPGQQEIPY